MIEPLTQSTFPQFGGLSANPVLMVPLFIALSLVPFMFLAVTSFLKLSVVFGILRNALGAQQVPSASVSSLLALVLTIQIMSPVMSETTSLLDKAIEGRNISNKNQPWTVSSILEVAKEASLPLESFLIKHSRTRERIFFAQLGKDTAKLPEDKSVVSKDNLECGEGSHTNCRPRGETLFTLVSSFVLSELYQAFAIGFSIFLPFLVIDLVTANLLVGLGMMMVSPVTVSLPFKLILFVLCDGWFLLCRSLVLSYQ